MHTEIVARNAADEGLHGLTSNRLLARELARYHAVLHAIPDGIVVIDTTGRIALATGGAGAYLNCAPEEAMGKRARECLRDGDVIDLLEPESAVTASVGVRTAELAPEGDRPDTTVYHNLVGTQENSDFGQVLVFRNILRLKSMERLQREFVDNVAHELRTPLTSIRAYVELLIDDEAPDLQTKRDFYNVIYEETYRLSQLIDNLLNISMLESGMARLEVAPVRVKRLIEEALEVFRAPCEAKSLRLVADLPDRLPTLNVDKSLFHVALMNILNNAVKFTPEGGAISVSTASREEELHIVVSDTGPGIAAKDLERIFEKFYRAASTQHVHGSGVGLATAYQVLRLHGGDIRVSSVEGEGSHFTLVVPRSLINTSIGE